MIEAAEVREISCSSDCPPKITATLSFFCIPLLYLIAVFKQYLSLSILLAILLAARQAGSLGEIRFEFCVNRVLKRRYFISICQPLCRRWDARLSLLNKWHNTLLIAYQLFSFGVECIKE
jgi:hypothetical protein